MPREYCCRSLRDRIVKIHVGLAASFAVLHSIATLCDELFQILDMLRCGIGRRQRGRFGLDDTSRGQLVNDILATAPVE